MTKSKRNPWHHPRRKIPSEHSTSSRDIAVDKSPNEWMHLEYLYFLMHTRLHAPREDIRFLNRNNIHKCWGKRSSWFYYSSLRRFFFGGVRARQREYYGGLGIFRTIFACNCAVCFNCDEISHMHFFIARSASLFFPPSSEEFQFFSRIRRRRKRAVKIWFRFEEVRAVSAVGGR